MSLTPEAVLAYISEHGPAVPNHIRQALGAKDNFVVGAVLSELVQSGKLSLTSLTYGTSKFYYDPKRSELLEPLGLHLGEKDRRAFELLQRERVVRHSELTPLNRVAIASIADFSRALPVETPMGLERFWRYYLVSEDDAFDLIIQRWFPSHAVKSGAVPPPVHAPDLVTRSEPHVRPPETKKEEKIAEAPAKATQDASISATPAPVEAKVAAPKKKTAEKKRSQQKRATVPKGSKSPAAPSEFSQTIAEYFSVRNIRLYENLGSNKNELTALVRVPSAIGEMHYYCKAKTKKLTTDGDLASAFLEAQQRGLPLLYLAAGSLSKKAQETLPTLKGAVVAKPFSDQAEAEH